MPILSTRYAVVDSTYQMARLFVKCSSRNTSGTSSNTFSGELTSSVAVSVSVCSVGSDIDLHPRDHADRNRVCFIQPSTHSRSRLLFFIVVSLFNTGKSARASLRCWFSVCGLSVLLTLASDSVANCSKWQCTPPGKSQAILA